MTSRFRVIPLLALAMLALAVLPNAMAGDDQRCGMGVPGYPNGKSCSGANTEDCCSQYGYCGLTEAYCEPASGCQSEWGWGCYEKSSDETDDGRCGLNVPGHPNGKRCMFTHSEHCCSQYGYCGTTDAYCGKGCQSHWGNGCN